MSLTNYRVLHVDDDPAMTELVGRCLARYGIEVTAINDPRRVLDLLLREQFHVVLIDVDMPGINGIDLLDDVKRLDGGIGVIMVTCVVSTSTVIKSRRSGAAACFFKPVADFGPLAETIQAEFTKIDRWRSSLRELAQHQRQGVFVPELAADPGDLQPQLN